MWLKKRLTYERRSEACINDRVWSSWCDCGWQDVKIQLLIATTPANPVKHISQDIPVTNIHTSPAEILILSFCESSVKINYFPLFTKHYSAQLHLWFPFRGTVCPFFTAPPCHTHRVAEGFNFVRHVQHSHPCCSSLSILHQYVPFISSPHLTASPFSEISHDNVPAGLRDVHRTICGVFFCVIRADLLVMVFAWCAQNYQWRFAWDAHRCQWRLVCDVHRTISDGLCVMGTDLSVRLKASIPPTLSAHTPSPPHPTPPHPTLLPLPPFSMISHYDIPDGLCVMRTALSVVFTCCPPAPVARNVSISRSLGFTLMSICKTICCLCFSDIIIFGTFAR